MAHLIHIVNEAWLKTELNRVKNLQIFSLQIAVKDKADEEECYQLLQTVKQKYPRFKNIPVGFLREDKFKQYGSLPDYSITYHFDGTNTVSAFYYDSVLFSHKVHDIFFKSEVLRNCGRNNEYTIRIV